MNRNKFEKIHIKYLHFNDNSKLDACDKLYKIRPLLDHLNDKFCQYVEPMGNHFSLDEAMETYFGHHGMKQFIRGKQWFQVLVPCQISWIFSEILSLYCRDDRDPRLRNAGQLTD